MFLPQDGQVFEDALENMKIMPKNMMIVPIAMPAMSKANPSIIRIVASNKT